MIIKGKALIFLFLFVSFTVYSQEELGIYERLDEYIPEDLVFVTEDYDTVKMMSLIDKPTIIVPVYYECPGLCSPLLEGVSEVISRATIELGKDYQVFTVSFDPTENTKLAIDKKRTYSRLVEGYHDLDNGWKFFTGDSTNINTLLSSIGYQVKKTGVDYIHPGAIIVLSPEGKITRYLHGTYFLPFDLKMAVVEASEGKSGPTINKVLKFCFSYDAEGKKYVFNVTKVSGVVIMLFALALFMTLFIKNKTRKNKFTNES
jgi:protein SCO1/2